MRVPLKVRETTALNSILDLQLNYLLPKMGACSRSIENRRASDLEVGVHGDTMLIGFDHTS